MIVGSGFIFTPTNGVELTMSDWLEAERRVEKAQLLFESRLWAEALEEIDAALTINPHNPSWHAHRGCLLEELDRWEEAAEAYQMALELDSTDADVALAFGAVLARLGRFSRALTIFEDLAKQYPGLEPAYCHRIGIYGEIGRHDQAEEMFYLAQDIDDECPQCFFHMAGSLITRGRFDRAIYCLRRVLELEPEYPGVNRRIARAHRAQGNRDLAKEYYLREVREDPGNTDVLYELAEMTLESGKVARAAARFAQILELDPDHIESHYALGRIWLLRDQPEAAIRCFENVRSITDDPDLPGFESKVGEALLRVGRYKEALEILEESVERYPDDLNSLILLGNGLALLDKSDRAADTFRRVLAIDADHAIAHECLAVCMLREGRIESGLNHSLLALRSKPDFAAAMHTAIRGHLELGHWRDARSMIGRALRLDPENADLKRLRRRFPYYLFRHAIGWLSGPFRRHF
jgi:tetratricopeptide (TPR) repeat protein